jgi:TolB protein
MIIELILNFLIMSLFLLNSSYSEQSDYGIFQGGGDVGPVAIKGSAAYNPETQAYRIEGAGINMWFDTDEFHFLWKKISGDFILRAQVEFIGEGVEAHRKIGWIVRNSLDSNSPHVNACVHGDGLTALQFRKTVGGETEEVKTEETAPNVIQLERRGATYLMSTAVFGQPFKTVEVSDIALNDSVYAGLYVCSHNPDISEKAIFRNVRIILPADKDFKPYQDFIGSNLEIMDIATGHRKIIYTAPNSLQAPNWTLDGRSLIYNSEGKLFTFNLKKGSPEVIDTDFATANNNDHVISFDGRMMGISHHSEADSGRSVIYTLPINGGKPKRITANSPSYLHGWSVDGKELIYTGGRNGQYDIYKVSIETGVETQLTDTPGLNDGSEYTPDGHYIYFNSNRTGTMQIWRMKPDGSAQEQITFDAFNDWFPHISPDGKSIVFLSYLPEVDSGDHPFYKQVYLRMMPIEGGEPSIIAYVYGGQGTINVPSWSPDSKQIAFVSNTKIGKNP